MRRLLYTLCFFFLCVIDQRIKTCSGLDGWLETFRNLTGVVMAVLIMSHYKKQDFIKYKIPYLVWTGISMVGAIGAFVWGMGNYPFMNAWIVGILDVILFGYIVIHIVIDMVAEKKVPRLNKQFTLVWGIMMLLMVLSRSEYNWPLCYLIMFLSFVLTSFDEKEQEDMFQGMLNGVILGFFILQGLCFVFRPYDYVRYVGFYSNPNINALFYLEVLAVALVKLIWTWKNNGKWWMKAFYTLGCGVVLSFMILSIGRTAWIVSVVLILIGLWSLWRARGHKGFIKSGITMVVCVCVAFPLCFGAVRYLPPLFHHPIWFWGEWSETKVHSWDPWDSEKYIDLDEFADAALGRIAASIENLFQHSSGESGEVTVSWGEGSVEVLLAAGENAAGAQTAEAAEPEAEVAEPKVEAAESEAEAAEPDTEAVDPEAEVVDDRYERAVFKDPNVVSDSLLTRGTIYKHYFSNLNLRGHPESEQGFQLTPVYWIGHAHNIYLQYGTDFGIPMMVLFIVLLVWAAVIFVKKILSGQEAEGTGWLLFMAVTALFGLLEYSWGTGSLSTFMMFFAWAQAMKSDKKAVRELTGQE